MVNRAAVLLRYREPAVAWINEADPCDDNPGITLPDTNAERTIYLISDEDADDPETFEKWLKANCLTLFETELEGWYVDASLWPKNRDFKTFKTWFSVECHTVLLDTVGTGIVDDET